MFKILTAVAAAFGMAAAFAQAPAAAPAAASALPKPVHNCKKPDRPGRLALDSQRKMFQRNMDGYRDCMQKFAADQQEIAKVAVDAANGAINEYNEFIQQLKKEQEEESK